MKTKSLVITAILVAGVPAAFAADAKTNWADHCAKCHGETGKGDTKMGRRLHVKDYSDPSVQAQLKDEDMVRDTLNGVKVDGKQRMRGFSDVLSPEDAKALVELIRSFKS